MKKLLLLLSLLAVIVFADNAKAGQSNAYRGDYFYSSISPYGNWIELEPGFVVWRPTNIRRGWAPYRSGRWMWTSYGWYWDSYEPFGHIVYHYGRWYHDDYYGWIWVPDYEWAPAWVEWRYDNHHIGWAPLPPYAAFSINIGIHFTHSYYVPVHHYHFVTYRYFCDPYLTNYYINSKQKVKVFSKTKYRTNYAYRDGRVINRGVDVDIIRNRSGRNVTTRDIERVRDPGEIRSSTGKERDNDAIRTYIASRDEIQRTIPGNIDVRKSDRKSSLEVRKVELPQSRDIGERVNREKSNISPQEVKRDAAPERKDAVRNGNENSLNERNNSREVNERKVNTDMRAPERVPQRNDVQKNEIQRKEAPKVQQREMQRLAAPQKEVQRNEIKREEPKVERREPQRQAAPQREAPKVERREAPRVEREAPKVERKAPQVERREAPQRNTERSDDDRKRERRR